MKTILLLNDQIDVTAILPTERVSTLVVHRRTDDGVPVALGRKLASQIPGARLIEYLDGDHAFWTGDSEVLIGDIEEFVTGHRDNGAVELERILATVSFTDIVDSTRRAAEMGDQRWRALLDNHDHLAHQITDKHRGAPVKSTGDGVLATVDGPDRAIRCALAFSVAAQQIGLPLRSGPSHGRDRTAGPGYWRHRLPERQHAANISQAHKRMVPFNGDTFPVWKTCLNLATKLAQFLARQVHQVRQTPRLHHFLHRWTAPIADF